MILYRYTDFMSFVFNISYRICFFEWAIKGFNSSITTILFEDGSYRPVVG